MIEHAVNAFEKKSPYYHHHLRLLKHWEALCERYGGTISGTINGFHMEFEISIPKGGQLLKVKALRYLNNVKVGNMARYNKIVYTKLTDFSIGPLHAQSPDFSIRKLTLMEKLWFKYKGQFRGYMGQGEYALISEAELNPQFLLPDGLWESFAAVTEIRDISVEDGIFTVRFFNFVGTQNGEKVIETLLEEFGA